MAGTALCVYAPGVPLLQRLHRRQGAGARRPAHHSGHTYKDGSNYVPSPKWVLFGHHFAAIAGAGPLVGPTLAAQFGFAPGFLWLLIGAVLAGCVQDLVVLVASVRHKGRSLADIARTEISPFAGLVAMVAVLFHSAGHARRPGHRGGQRAGQAARGASSPSA
jgi:hypothetical protein